MRKWIRWYGLVIFLVLVALWVFIWFFLVDWATKRVIEKAGTKLVGAKVELRRADVTMFPLGMTLIGLQVTNREEPMRNAVEIERMAFNLDGLNLLRHKVIIDEMSAQGLRFNTQRKTSGALWMSDHKKREKIKKEAFRLPTFRNLDIKQIIKNENLESLAFIENTRTDIKNKTDSWRKRIDALPNQKTIEDYKARIDKLKKSGGNITEGLGQVADAAAIAKDIKQDIGRVNNAREELGKDLASIKPMLTKAQQAPMNDVRKLMDKYGMSPQGLANLSGLLFGGVIREWVHDGLVWNDRLRPLYDRVKSHRGKVIETKPLRESGVDVRFKEYHPLPDFLVRTVQSSLQLSAGAFSGTIRNLTPDQDVLGSPLTFKFSGQNLRDLRAIHLDGILNHVLAAAPEDKIVCRVQGYNLRDLILLEEEALPIALQAAVVDFDLTGSKIKDRLGARIQSRVSSARFKVGGQDAFAQAIANALSQVSHFTLTTDVAGTMEDYNVKIASDLDRVLEKAAGKVFQQEYAKAEQQLMAAVQEKTSGALQELNGTYNEFLGVNKAVTDIQGQLNDLLQVALQQGTGKLKLPF